MMRIPTPSPASHSEGTAPSEIENAEALADSLKAEFQAVTAPSVPAVIEMVDVQVESYFQASAGDPMLTNTDEVQNTIRGVRVVKAPGPNGTRNRALKHLHTRAVLTLVHNFNAILRIHHVPPL